MTKVTHWTFYLVVGLFILGLFLVFKTACVFHPGTRGPGTPAHRSCE